MGAWHRIQVFDTNGNFVRQWGRTGSGNGEFLFDTSFYTFPRTSTTPAGVGNGGIVAMGGYLYVSDYGNSRIQCFSSSGTYISQFPVSYGRPRFLQKTDNNTLVVMTTTDDFNWILSEYQTDGTFVRCQTLSMGYPNYLLNVYFSPFIAGKCFIEIYHTIHDVLYPQLVCGTFDITSSSPLVILGIYGGRMVAAGVLQQPSIAKAHFYQEGTLFERISYNYLSPAWDDVFVATPKYAHIVDVCLINDSANTMLFAAYAPGGDFTAPLNICDILSSNVLTPIGVWGNDGQGGHFGTVVAATYDSTCNLIFACDINNGISSIYASVIDPLFNIQHFALPGDGAAVMHRRCLVGETNDQLSPAVQIGTGNTAALQITPDGNLHASLQQDDYTVVTRRSSDDGRSWSAE